MFFNELKVLLLMRSGSSRRTNTGTDTQTRMRGLTIGGCGWPQLSCSHRDDEEEYYGSDPRPRSLAFEDKEEEGDKPQEGGLDAASLPSLSESGIRSPQCRICFQGPEKVKLGDERCSFGLTLWETWSQWTSSLLMSTSAGQVLLGLWDYTCSDVTFALT